MSPTVAAFFLFMPIILGLWGALAYGGWRLFLTFRDEWQKEIVDKR